MPHILSDKTNTTSMQLQKQANKNEKETVVHFLKDISNKTKDFSFKYDLSKCIEIIEGKENQEVLDLKNALEEALIENEMLTEERGNLIVENEYLKEQISK